MKIKYKIEKGLLITPCPYKLNVMKHSNVLAGSSACERYCDYFQATSYNGRYVICNFIEHWKIYKITGERIKSVRRYKHDL